MPRWDQTDETARSKIIRVLLEVVEDDYAIDVCAECDKEHGGNLGNVDHPPYEETDYECELCGKILTEADNG